MLQCLMCKNPNPEIFHRGDLRSYLRCPACNLIYVPVAQHMSSMAEKARYDLHNNSPGDQSYRKFLGRLFDPLRACLAPGSSGLDFGSGPGPTLSVMFGEAGYPMEIYDYFYATDTRVLAKQYDFITATEVAEHLREPAKELDRLWSCLRPGGILGIMTKMAPQPEDFAQWYYQRDPSHICFYSKETFEWLAARWKATLTFPAEDIILLRKA